MLNIVDAQQDSRFNPEIDKKTNYYTRNILAVPLLDHEQHCTLGVLEAINKKTFDYFTKEDEAFLIILASIASKIFKTSVSNDSKTSI